MPGFIPSAITSITQDMLSVPIYKISNDIYVSDDAEKGTNSPTPVLIKEFTLPDDFPENTTLRIYFEIKVYNAGTAFAQIYRNDSPVGTQRSFGGSGYKGYTEDIGGWNPGDRVQLYLWYSGENGAWTRNFRILGTIIPFRKYDITVTK